MKKIYLVLVLMFTAILGCEVVPFISPIVNLYVKWVDGEATAYYAIKSDQAYEAVKRVLSDLNYTIVEEERKSNNHYYIVAHTQNKFKINIVQIEEYTTKVSIRINTMGDKPHAELIYEKLKDQLDVIDFTKFEDDRRQRLRFKR